jgi:MFS family permease
VAARAVQGAGAALATPAALALLTATFAEGPERVRALGVWTAAAPVGGATGLLLGGALTQALGWPSVFLVSVPVVVCALALAPRILPKGIRRARPSRVDLPGAVLGTAAIVALVFALSHAEAAGFVDAVVLAAFAGAGGAAICFALWERRARDPLLPPGTLLRRRPLARAVLVSLVLTAATSPPLFFITLHLQSALGWSPTESGLAFLPVVLAVVGAATLAPRVIAARGAGRLRHRGPAGPVALRRRAGRGLCGGDGAEDVGTARRAPGARLRGCSTPRHRSAPRSHAHCGSSPTAALESHAASSETDGTWTDLQERG